MFRPNEYLIIELVTECETVQSLCLVKFFIAYYVRGTLDI